MRFRGTRYYRPVRLDENGYETLDLSTGFAPVKTAAKIRLPRRVRPCENGCGKFDPFTGHALMKFTGEVPAALPSSGGAEGGYPAPAV